MQIVLSSKQQLEPIFSEKVPLKKIKKVERSGIYQDVYIKRQRINQS
jgi:hypothetical protein